MCVSPSRPSTPRATCAPFTSSSSASACSLDEKGGVLVRDDDRPDGSSLNKEECDRLNAATPYPGLSTEFAIGLVIEIEASIAYGDWRTVEDILLRLLITELQPGDLSKLARTQIGPLLYAIERGRINAYTSLSVRLATAIVSIWSSHLRRLKLAHEQVASKRRRWRT